MAGGGEDSFIQPLGLLLGLTAFVALLLSYAKQSTIISFILVGVMVNSVGVTRLETTTLGHFSEVGILILIRQMTLNLREHYPIVLADVAQPEFIATG